MSKLFDAAEKAVKMSLALKKGEPFLLVTDKAKLEIAEALAYWAKEVGAETTTYLMTETLRPINAPTGLFKELIERASAVLYLLDARIEEKPFRGYMVKTGVEKGRICMMPGLTHLATPARVAASAKANASCGSPKAMPTVCTFGVRRGITSRHDSTSVRKTVRD